MTLAWMESARYERKPKNEEELLQLGQKMADIMSQGGKKYSRHSLAQA